jgi:hypothetical protein
MGDDWKFNVWVSFLQMHRRPNYIIQRIKLALASIVRLAVDHM